MKYVARHILGAVKRAMVTFPVLLVTGARQTGKTTLLVEEFGEDFTYVSLERPDVREHAASDPVGFLASVPGPVILDEIQHAPELLSYVKDAVDRNRRPGQWLLTGSQTFALMQGVSQTLAGRIAVLDLDPLSTSEVAGTELRDIDGVIDRVFSPTSRARSTPAPVPELGTWLLRGGYPEPCLDPRVDRQLWFSSYVQTYLERDVRDILGVTNLRTFARFLSLVAARTASLLNMSALADEVGVTGPTVKSWLSVLEAAHIVHLVPPYHRNFGKRIRKAPKLYVVDPGIVSYLIGLHTEEAILAGPSAGALTETAVVAEWLKAFRSNGERPSLFFWSSAAIEIDLLIERNGQLWALEIKSTATPRPRHAEGLQRWRELAPTTAGAALACRVERPAALVPGIRAIPWHLAW